IERADRLIVRDMLLRLGGQDVGQCEVWRIVHVHANVCNEAPTQEDKARPKGGDKFFWVGPWRGVKGRPPGAIDSFNAPTKPGRRLCPGPENSRGLAVMKFLVTGVAGFIGYHTAARLLDRGDEVVGVDNVNSYYDPALKRARLAKLGGREGFSFLH